MKKTLYLVLLYCLCIHSLAYSQTYQWDYITNHTAANGVVENKAIRKNAANNSYYIAQQLHGTGNRITISEVDNLYNVLNTWEYQAMTGSGADAVVDNTMHIDIKDINFFGNQVILVGSYIREGIDNGAFMMSVNKTTGAFQWFDMFKDLDNLNAVECNNDIRGSIAVGWRISGGNGTQFPITQESGVMMRVNSAGAIVWEEDIEDDKYMSTSITAVANHLLDVIRIDGTDLYAAVGFTSVVASYPWDDGDGLLLIMNGNGSIAYHHVLGNMTPVMPGGTQKMQYENAQAVENAGDGDLVIAGNVLNFPYTDFPIVCPGPVPDNGGLWVTKINPYTGIIAWSKVYDAPGAVYDAFTAPDRINVHIVNDGANNFGISYADQPDVYNSYPSILKVDQTGNLVYSRRYNNDLDYLLDVSSGIGTTDIMSVGIRNNFSAWNVAAFDNVMSYCQSQDRPLTNFDHPYDVFESEVQGFTSGVSLENFQDVTETVYNNIDCDKIQMSPKAAVKANKVLAITQDIQTGTVLVTVPANESYDGTLINAMGQIIATYSKVDKDLTIHTNDLIGGVYYLHFNNAKNSVTKKIIVQ